MAHRKIEDDLGRIEGIDPARPPFVLLEYPVETSGQGQHPVAHDGDGDRIDEVAVEQVEVGALALDFRQDVFLGKLRVGGAAEEEFFKSFHVEGRGRHAEDNGGGLVRRLAHGADVAGSAIDENAVDALIAALRGADGEVAVAAVRFLFVDHAQRLVALARQILRADLGQRLPDPVREPHFVLAAGRTVLEMFGRAGVVDRDVFAEAFQEQQPDESGDDDGDDKENQEAALPGAGG
jgi:hypothetical protein